MKESPVALPVTDHVFSDHPEPPPVPEEEPPLLADWAVYVGRKMWPGPHLFAFWFARYSASLMSPAGRQTLWALGRRLTGDEDLGFTFAERFPPQAYGLIYRWGMAGPSMRIICQSFLQWSSLWLDVTPSELVEAEDKVWARVTYPAGLVADRADQDCQLLAAAKRVKHL